MQDQGEKRKEKQQTLKEREVEYDEEICPWKTPFTLPVNNHAKLDGVLVCRGTSGGLLDRLLGTMYFAFR